MGGTKITLSIKLTQGDEVRKVERFRKRTLI